MLPILVSCSTDYTRGTSRSKESWYLKSLQYNPDQQPITVITTITNMVNERARKLGFVAILVEISSVQATLSALYSDRSVGRVACFNSSTETQNDRV